MCLFDSLGFLSEILGYVLHYLFATSASFQEQSNWRVWGRGRGREEERDRGQRKRIIVEAGDGGVNSREIGRWEENMWNKSRKKLSWFYFWDTAVGFIHELTWQLLKSMEKVLLTVPRVLNHIPNISTLLCIENCYCGTKDSIGLCGNNIFV